MGAVVADEAHTGHGTTAKTASLLTGHPHRFFKRPHPREVRAHWELATAEEAGVPGLLAKLALQVL